MSRIRLPVLLAALSLSAQGSAASPPLSAEPDPFALAPPPVVGIASRKNIRVVYDVQEDRQAAGVGRGLYYARGLMESYRALGVTPQKVKMSVVLHGASVSWAMNEEAYRQHLNDPFAYNPHEHAINTLLGQGVRIEVCNVTLRGHGWTADDMLPGVIIVHDAYSRIVDLQQQGYAYLRF